MKFNVVTPMSRFQNVKPLLDMIREQEIVNWHVITDDDLKFSLEFEETWAKGYVCPNRESEFWARSNYSLNWFIENHMTDDGYWCFLNDDDAYETDFFRNLKKNIKTSKSLGSDTKAIICGMERGDNTPFNARPESRHPNYRLPAHPAHTHVGGVGLEQIIAKGSVIKQHRFPINVCGDGMFIEEVAKTNNILYLDDLNVWFNYYEPGRWNK